jgi:hypothetical protein
MTKKAKGPDTTGAKVDTRFKPGAEWNGNAAGRPKGSKHKLSEEFIAALCADFEKNGKDVIEKVRTDKPADYLRIVASLVPKELNLNSDSRTWGTKISWRT